VAHLWLQVTDIGVAAVYALPFHVTQDLIRPVLDVCGIVTLVLLQILPVF
jgi:hypothetical protein